MPIIHRSVHASYFFRIFSVRYSAVIVSTSEKQRILCCCSLLLINNIPNAHNIDRVRDFCCLLLFVAFSSPPPHRSFVFVGLNPLLHPTSARKYLFFGFWNWSISQKAITNNTEPTTTTTTVRRRFDAVLSSRRHRPTAFPATTTTTLTTKTTNSTKTKTKNNNNNNNNRLGGEKFSF